MRGQKHGGRTAPFAALGVLLVISALGLPARLSEPAPWLFELAILALGSYLAIRATLRALGPDRAAAAPIRVAVALLLVISAGQLVRTKKTFPWMPYTMYGRSCGGEVLFHRFTAQHASGRSSAFRPSLAMASLGGGRIAKGLHKRLEELAALRAAGKPAAEQERLLRQVIARLAERSLRPGDSDPVIAIDVERVTLAPPYDVRARRGSALLRVPMTEAP